MVLAAATVITAGCGGSYSSQTVSSSPSSAQPSSVGPSDMSNEQAPPTRLYIDVTIQRGDVTPANEQLQAAVKETVVLRVSSDAADEIHVNSTPEHTFKLEADKAQSFQFNLDAPGQVDIKLQQLNRVIATIQVQ